MPSKAYGPNIEPSSSHAPPEVLSEDHSSDVYLRQMNRRLAAHRSLVNTMSRQLITGAHYITRITNGVIKFFTITDHVLKDAKDYLTHVSAVIFPPLIAGFDELGIEPFLLYQIIGYDKLHNYDLGLACTLPDFAFVSFGSPDYSFGK